MDSTQRYRMRDLAKWVRIQIREGGWNTEVHDAVLNHVVGETACVVTVIMKDNKRLKVTVEAVE